MYSKNGNLNKSITEFRTELGILKDKYPKNENLLSSLNYGVLELGVNQLEEYFKITDFLFDDFELSGLNVVIGANIEYVRGLNTETNDFGSDIASINDFVKNDFRYLIDIYKDALIKVFRNKADDLFTHLKSFEGVFSSYEERQKFIFSILPLKTTPELAFIPNSSVNPLNVDLVRFGCSDVNDSLVQAIEIYDELKAINLDTVSALDNSLVFFKDKVSDYVLIIQKTFNSEGCEVEYDIHDVEGVMYTLESKLPLEMLQHILKGNWYSSKTQAPVDFTIEKTKRLKVYL